MPPKHIDKEFTAEPPKDGGSKGAVYLLGAGPGDPAWLTRAGEEVCRRADVIFHDRLALPVLEGLRLPASTRLVDVGKRPGAPKVPQEEIEEAMAREALSGRTVVRLKGGDPFIFGRGGEEAETLRRLGVPTHCIPGLSAFQAAALALQIPLTHREVSSSLELITGHEVHLSDFRARRAWIARADSLRSGGTLAVYMGRRNLGRLAEGLLSCGCPPWMPAAVVFNASLPSQAVVRARLVNIAGRAAALGLDAPAMIIVGRVLLRTWQTWPERQGTLRCLVLGHEASIYHDDWDLEVTGSREAAFLMLARPEPNERIFSTLEDPRWIETIQMNRTESVVAVRDSLAARGWSMRDLAATRFVTPFEEDRRSAALLLELEPESAERLPKRTNLVQVELSDESRAEEKDLSFPDTTYAANPDALRQVPTLLETPSLSKVVVCDPQTATLAMPWLLEAVARRGLSLFARDRATQAFLATNGLSSQPANRLKSVIAPEACPTN